MNDFSEIVKRYTIKYDKKIKELTCHLNNNSNISTYTYYKIDSDGRIVTFSNNPHQLDFYYSEKYYLNNPYLVDPSLLKSGLVFTAQTKDEKYLDTVNTSLNRFQMDNTFLMLEKNEGQVEGFFYASRPNECNFNYISNVDILKKFNRYFVQEMSGIIKKMHAEGFNLKTAKGKSFCERKEGLPLAFKDKSSNEFLKIISPLSQQEERCLTLFRLGYSAQATASVMGLSRRTVEHYFESIKDKLGCRSKWDLLK